MLSQFIDLKLSQASYKLLKDGFYFGAIPKLNGVWANAITLEECREELREVLEAWLVIKLRSGENIVGLKMPREQVLLQHA